MTTDDVDTRLRGLQEQYQRIVADELRAYESALSGMATVWPHLPETRQPPLTIPAIFGRPYDENFVSDYLAYALNPERNGIGTAPLERLLEAAFPDMEPLALGMVDIQREVTFDDGGRIDLLVLIDDDVVVGLENKVFAAEGNQQTRGYARAIAKLYPDRQRYCIFLTRDGRAASSREFAPLSYARLVEALRPIRYDWASNVKKSVLWEDLLEHLEVYIAMNRDLPELSRKAQLYIEHHQMIQDIQRAYEQDAERFFNEFAVSVQQRFDGDVWFCDFRSTRVWQVFRKKLWSIEGFSVYYQFWPASRDMLLRQSAPLEVVTWGKPSDSFIALFKPRLQALKHLYDAKGIQYRPRHRSIALAWKEYAIDPNEPKGSLERLLAAVDEFSFLTDVIDETMDEFRKAQHTSS